MKVPNRRLPSQHFTITPKVQHFLPDQVVVEERRNTTLPWKLSVGRYLALGTTLNETTIELFAKVATGDLFA